MAGRLSGRNGARRLAAFQVGGCKRQSQTSEVQSARALREAVAERPWLLLEVGRQIAASAEQVCSSGLWECGKDHRGGTEAAETPSGLARVLSVSAVRTPAARIRMAAGVSMVTRTGPGENDP